MTQITNILHFSGRKTKQALAKATSAHFIISRCSQFLDQLFYVCQHCNDNDVTYFLLFVINSLFFNILCHLQVTEFKHILLFYIFFLLDNKNY